jgi:multisubunit Na+/H+ antiporter MnhB subunit
MSYDDQKVKFYLGLAALGFLGLIFLVPGIFFIFNISPYKESQGPWLTYPFGPELKSSEELFIDYAGAASLIGIGILLIIALLLAIRRRGKTFERWKQDFEGEEK